MTRCDGNQTETYKPGWESILEWYKKKYIRAYVSVSHPSGVSGLPENTLAWSAELKQGSLHKV